MVFRDIPIQRKLMTVIMLTSGAVLLLTCAAFFAYEFHTFRQTTVRQLSILGKIIATNSTAALAFQNNEEASEILIALKAEQNIVAASLYDEKGRLFSRYPSNLKPEDLPIKPAWKGYRFTNSFLEGFQPVIEGDRSLGTLYIKSDLRAMRERFKLYAIIALLVIALASFLAYLLSKALQKGISKPILALAQTAKIISDYGDYTVRATKVGKDELGTLTDAFNLMLTQIQQQNEVLSEFTHTLEKNVVERTQELENANKELEAFSYSISHDLRAPLRSIHGFMVIFSESYANKLDEEAKRLMTIILSNAKKMGQLIDDLLAFSKLGRRELKKAKISMQTMVSEVWEELSRSEKNRNIEFILKALPDAYADHVTIRQVWINLLSNALKYTRNREKAVIEVSWEENDEEIIYSVKDNGTGFDMQYYNKLFGVFQRLHTDEEFEGTGVGLAIIQRIVKKHGGDIWATAKLNEGATFYFSMINNAVPGG